MRASTPVLWILLALAACGTEEDKDLDDDGYAPPADCDDANAETWPGAPEVCDGFDNNCNGLPDEDLFRSYYQDADGDGYGVREGTAWDCQAPPGFVENADDCDDASAAVSPGAPEQCNGLDDNCDGVSDDGVSRSWYADADGDGYGDPATRVDDCDAPEGMIADGTDCDDGEPHIHPGAEELCDGDDDDCDGRPDSGMDATWYRDGDGDGFGDPDNSQLTCIPEDGWVLDATDCDDSSDRVAPGLAESCNGVDDDCNGATDEVFDLDEDGWLSDACEEGTDCDDTDATVHPEAPETCEDERDQDCNGYDAVCGLAGAYELAMADARLYPHHNSFDAGRLLDLADVNGDGADDLLIATLYAYGTSGGAYLAYGPLANEVNLDEEAFFLQGERGGGSGRSIGMNDTDGDGLADIMLGTPYHTENGGYLFHGPITANMTLSEADVTLVGRTGGYCGHGSDVGDVNDDGMADAVVGCYNTNSAAGTVYVHYSPLEGDLDLDDDWDAKLNGTRSSYTGRVLVVGQDMDGDGVGDLLLPGVYANEVYLMYGPVTGEHELEEADATFRGSGGEYAGYAIAQGDVNGDGISDAVVGSQQRAYVDFGPVEGTVYLSEADVVMEGDVPRDAPGSGVAAGDIDGDGAAEILVGATGSGGAGAAYLYSGPLSGTFTLEDAQASLTGESPGDAAGQGVSIGDFNGDGWGDLSVGAPSQSTGGPQAGAAYVQFAVY